MPKAFISGLVDITMMEAAPQPPLGFWGGVAPPYVDIGPPGPQPPRPGQPPSGAHPAHPIWRPDLGFWGGRPPEYVDIGGPAPQPRPEHPIYIPVTPPATGEGGEPTHPIYIPVYPTHPIVLPPGAPEQIVRAIKEFINFWTGNLPPPPSEPAPTPV